MAITKDKIIVAVDKATSIDAADYIESLIGVVDTFKLGHEIIAQGEHWFLSSMIGKYSGYTAKVFLDMKLYDIPTTLNRTLAVIAKHESVEYVTVHRDVINTIDKSVCPNIKLLAVGSLTSSRAHTLPGFQSMVDECNNADGFITPCYFIAEAKRRTNKEIIVPGIRDVDTVRGYSSHDQVAHCSPQFALTDGATKIILGRTLSETKDPRMTLEKMMEIHLP